MRAYIIQRDYGLCVRCEEPGDIVHHIVPLTPGNVHDDSIAYGDGNLELVCLACHNDEHRAGYATADGLAFNANGDLVACTPRSPGQIFPG